MKRILWIILLVIIIILATISTYNFILNSILVKKINTYKENLEIYKQASLFDETEMAYLFSQNLLSSGLVLRNISVTNEKGIKFRLNILFGNNPKFVLRYSEINCMTCVDSSLKYIEKYKKIIGPENIIVLASYKNQQDLAIFKRVSKIEFEIFNTGENTVGLPIEKENTPFMFITNGTLIAQSVFLPEKTMPELTEMYFMTIISRYFSYKN